MAIERFYITNVGNNYLALAHGGKKLIINRCAIGTGFLESNQSSVSRTALVSYLCDMPIAGSSVSGGTLNVKVQFSNALSSGNIRDPFLWAEVGLYGYIEDDTSHPEALLCYAKACRKRDEETDGEWFPVLYKLNKTGEGKTSYKRFEGWNY